MKRSRSLLLATTLVALAVTCPSAASFASTTTPAEANSPTGNKASLLNYPLTLDPLKADAASISESTGVPLQEVLKQLSSETVFNELVETISGKFPESFAYAAFGSEGDPSVIGFAGTVPSDALGLVKLTGLQINLDSTYPVAATTRDTMANSALASFVKVTGADTASVSVDPQNLSISIDYGSVGAVVTDETARIVQQSAVSTQSSVKEIPDVRLFPAPDGQPAVTPEVMSGGAALGEAPFGGRLCTAGFTVRNTRGGVGLMTAAHCNNDLNYERRFVMNFAGEAKSVNTDAQWHTANDSVWNRFIWTNVGGYQTRLATSTNGSTVGSTVCNYGDNTGPHCTEPGPVRETGVPAYYDSTQFYGLTCMTRWVTDGGDSGGPWYVGEQARGVHSAKVFREGVARSCFTPISRIEGTTDLRVLTS